MLFEIWLAVGAMLWIKLAIDARPGWDWAFWGSWGLIAIPAALCGPMLLFVKGKHLCR